MFLKKPFLHLCWFVLLWSSENNGNKHYSDKGYDFNLTEVKDDPHPGYEDLVKIDEKLASCGRNVPDLREITIRQVQELFSNKKLSSARLITCYLNRIKHMNPYLNAVIEINPDAIKDALKSDYERFLGKTMKGNNQLHGIPILIKDNIATKDGMQTCSGSLALVGYKPLKEAMVVTLLRNAGAIILGKTNLSEFAKYFTKIKFRIRIIKNKIIFIISVSAEQIYRMAGVVVEIRPRIVIFCMWTLMAQAVALLSQLQQIFV